MKFCQTATLWISNCATSWNFKLRLPAKYYTNSQKTNCSNSPINTAFRRGIIHICQLFHCKAYFDKPQTATLNYIFRLFLFRLCLSRYQQAWSLHSKMYAEPCSRWLPVVTDVTKITWMIQIKEVGSVCRWSPSCDSLCPSWWPKGPDPTPKHTWD